MPVRVLVPLVAWLAVGCDTTSFAPVGALSIPPADEERWEVEWAPETVVAAADDVTADVADLDVEDGVYAIRAGSPMLDGVAEGTVVVWPGLGLFRVTALSPEGERVRVSTEPASFEDAATRVDMAFTHAFTRDEPGRVIGLALDPPTPGAPLVDVGAARAPLVFTADGVSDQRRVGSYDVDATLRRVGDTLRLDATFDHAEVVARYEVHATVRGLSVEGSYRRSPGEEDVAELRWDDVEVDLAVSGSVAEASGELEIAAPVALLVPFTVGPLPVFLRLATTFSVQSSIASESAFASASARFLLTGSFVLARTEGAGVSASGELTRFEVTETELDIDAPTTVGLGVVVDGPRVELGVGRPGIVSASIYASLSGEVVANVEVDPTREGVCETLDTNAAIFAGGSFTLFGIDPLEDMVELYGRTDQPVARGALCAETRP